MKYLSICSGIEAASVAWHPLGWQAAGYAEIDKFPSAALAHHYPEVPNFGDFTTIEASDVGPIDLLVGGTPCQSFSIAGLRGGLGDGRGNLSLEFLRLADRTRPKWLVWENVPGVLSSNGGRDFGAILGGMVELGYGFAYRVLDAQFCRVDGYSGAVPQRRRRVFVVGYLGDWRRAAAVLFERESMSGNPAPSRKTGQIAARSLTSSLGKRCGAPDADNASDGGLIAHTLNAKGGSGRIDSESESETFVPTAYRVTGNDGAYATGDVAGALNTATDPTQQVFAIQERAISENPDAGPDGMGVRDDGASYTLEARTVQQAVAFAENSRAELRLCGGDGQVSAQLTTGGGKPGQGQPCIADQWAVRRLTPTECERLQGFPDGYTQVPYRKKDAADGPRYKALGNSMAVNVMRWIGQRIDLCEKST